MHKRQYPYVTGKVDRCVMYAEDPASCKEAPDAVRLLLEQLEFYRTDINEVLERPMLRQLAGQLVEILRPAIRPADVPRSELQRDRGVEHPRTAEKAPRKPNTKRRTGTVLEMI